MRGSISASATLGAGVPSSGPLFLLHDTFTDSDGTALTSHVMNVGSGWTNLGTTIYDIQSNRARRTAGVAPSICHANAGAANGTGRVTITFDAADTFSGLTFRFVGSGNWWLFRAHSGGSSNWRLIENDAGVQTTRATATAASSAGTTRVLEIVLSGNDITCKLDGATLLTHSSALHNTATRWGLAAHNTGSTDTRFDDLEVLP